MNLKAINIEKKSQAIKTIKKNKNSLIRSLHVVYDLQDFDKNAD